MIQSKIFINLPSAEVDRKKTFGEWMGSLVGKSYDLRSGEEELSICALSMVAGICDAFEKAGVANAVSLLVDRHAIYIDHADVDNDLPLLLEVSAKSSVIHKPFDEMHLVLDHKESGLHTIIDVRIKNRVVLGEEEMTISLSSRVEALRVQEGETAAAYQARVKQFAAQGEEMERLLAVQEALQQRLSQRLGTALVGSAVRAERPTAQIIRPEARQVARFRELGFGDDVQKASYRPVPSHQRSGAYADPFYYYYYDPYYDLTGWLLVDSMIHDRTLHSSHVNVVTPAGETVHAGGSGEQISSDGWAEASALSIGASGALDVSSDIPTIEAVGATDAADFATGDADTTSTSDTSSGFFSDFFSSGGDSSDSSSSCGSSCSSGSSCGSSCGGGCGGGCGS